MATNLSVDATDAAGLARVVAEHQIDLVIVGPDAALAAGVTDACLSAGAVVFGPTAAGARIETSKVFAKEIMDASSIPTAAWRAGTVATRDELRDFAAALHGKCVVKADGLALGKGVVMCDDLATAELAITACLDDQRFGSAGERVVVEERLAGHEVSVFALCDGTRAHLLPMACDYKRAFDGDAGPNTGGMGAYTPPRELDGATLLDAVAQDVIQPCLDALAARDTPFRGCLYAGLMLTDDGLRVLEFNARFGDPETQALVMALDPGRFADLVIACAAGELLGNGREPQRRAAVAVVAAARGYPGAVTTGSPITLPLPDGSDTMIFHAGTAWESGTLLTAGGRVLAVAAAGDDVEVARERAYAVMDRVEFDGKRCRGDIGAAKPVAYSGQS